MARRTASALAGFGALAASVLLLAGCASTPQGTATPGDDGDDMAAEFEVDAAWVADGTMIGIVTEGSSTCVPEAESAEYQNGLLTVTLADADPDAACTRDLVPRVSLVAVPDGVDPTQPLEIQVSYNDASGDTDLDGVAGLGGMAEEGAPSAGWADDDQLVLVTYGSGSRACYPVAESVVAEAGVITATFAEPAADQVCTTDYRAQGTLLFVEGADSDEAYELVLTGFGFEPEVRIPVIGD